MLPKYSPEGSEIEVIVDQAGALRITDEGAGISDDDKQLLFQRFWRRDRRRGTSSVGLGLAIVQRIMAAHGGEIEVHRRSPPRHGVRAALSALRAGCSGGQRVGAV